MNVKKEVDLYTKLVMLLKTAKRKTTKMERRRKIFVMIAGRQ